MLNRYVRAAPAIKLKGRARARRENKEDKEGEEEDGGARDGGEQELEQEEDSEASLSLRDTTLFIPRSNWNVLYAY